jgi:hypothetical protein
VLDAIDAVDQVERVSRARGGVLPGMTARAHSAADDDGGNRSEMDGANSGMASERQVGRGVRQRVRLRSVDPSLLGESAEAGDSWSITANGHALFASRRSHRPHHRGPIRRRAPRSRVVIGGARIVVRRGFDAELLCEVAAALGSTR